MSCQFYIKIPFKLHPEDGFMKAETYSSYVLLINYILCNRVVLDCNLIYITDGAILCLFSETVM